MGHNFIGTEHQLVGIFCVGEGIAYEVLDNVGVRYAEARSVLTNTVGPGMDGDALAAIGIDLEAVRRTTEESFGPGSLDRALAGHPRSVMGPRFTPRAKKILELALREATILRHDYIGTEQVLLAIVREGRGEAAQVLQELAPQADLRQHILDSVRAAS